MPKYAVGRRARSSLEHVDDPSLRPGSPCTLSDPAAYATLRARRHGVGSDPRVWGETDHPCRTVAILGAPSATLASLPSPRARTLS